MKILVVGGGGREHALVWKLRQSPEVSEIYAAPGNAGIRAIANCVPIEPSDIPELADFAGKIGVDLTVVGPELPLTLGIVEEFRKRDLKIFGASQAAAEIESSKVFAKEFMHRHGIPTASFTVCSSLQEASAALSRRKKTEFPVVLKADGLAAGKGVLLAENVSEAQAAAVEIMERRKFGTAGDRLIIEDFLRGVETSFFVLSDGENIVPLVTCQDYKRAADHNRGPNTGGMGAISPSVAVTEQTFNQVMEQVFLPTIQGMSREGRPYLGVLYAGLMLTDAGPKVLEFNARFGDPEAQVLLPRLQTDLALLLKATVEKRLAGVRLQWHRDRAVCVVMASEGYPGSYEKGKAIEGLGAASRLPGVVIFHAGTRSGDSGATLTSGGRVLGVTALAPTFSRARSNAYRAVETIYFENRYHRRDIGEEAVAREKRGQGGSPHLQPEQGGLA